MPALPQLLSEALKDKGEISREQLDHVLEAAGFKGQTSAVLGALGADGKESVPCDTFLKWLYTPTLPKLAAAVNPASPVRPAAGPVPVANGTAPPAGEEAAQVVTKQPSIYAKDDIERMKEIMEVKSDVEEAMQEFQTMAAQLAADFQSRGRNPQAEAFIEQVCVEKILEGSLFVGHIKTDLDSVAGAIGAASLWRGVATRAERKLNGEITFALKFAGLEEPPYFDDVPGAVTPDGSGNLLSVCLVDHNEEKQMIESLRKDPDRYNRICGLIDHHCLSENFSSQKPVFMDVRPWGSMSSIVAHSFIRSNRPIPKPIARILLAAILSDTLNLQSVTATNADRMMVTLLSILGEVPDVDELARGMFRAKTEWIVNLGAYEMTRGDQKDFGCCGWKIGIAVLEVTDTAPVLAVADNLLLELRILKVEKGKCQSSGKHDRRKELDFSFIFVVDVTKQCSVLLICGGRELALAQAAFPGCPVREAKPNIRAPGETILAQQTLMEVGPIVSRKAEFVPAFFKALSAGFKCHKHPMQDLSEEDAMKEPRDEVYLAMKQMGRKSVHNSVQVVRDYKELTEAYVKRASLRASLKDGGAMPTAKQIEELQAMPAAKQIEEVPG